MERERVSAITQKALKTIEKKKEYSREIEGLIARVEDYADSREEHSGIDMSKEELNMISCALAYRKNQNDSDIAKMEKALECGSESGDLSIQSEKHILQGCIRLLCEAGDSFREYLEFIGVEPDEETPLRIPMQYGHIVKHLFLWNTYHSGGTSTRAKCRELDVNFDDEVEITENEDDDR